jgi:polyphosphate kinase
MNHTKNIPDTIGFFDRPSDRFINRELSWLEFNTRVLEAANDKAYPVLERVKFLSISSSNLDEFFMVRVARLKEMVRDGLVHISKDGLTPREQLQHIYRQTEILISGQIESWQNLREELEKEGISVADPKQLSKKEKSWLERHFVANLFPVLSPIAIDPAHPFPFLPNLGMAMVVKVRAPQSEIRRAIIRIPNTLERFVRLPSAQARHYSFILLEDVIELFLNHLFPNAEVTCAGVVRITRDSDLDIEEDAPNLVHNFERAVKQRRLGSVIRLTHSANMPQDLLEFVIGELDVEREDVESLDNNSIIDMSGMVELYNAAERPDLKFQPYVERFPERINDYGGDCFAAIAAKDIVVHHPYESFDVVVRFLQQAARDPDVVAIKQTLYRTSNDSPIVQALIEAAEAGKSVVAVVELKARFDEEKNIRWARDLERVGAQVVYGFVDLKTHAKLSLVLRREGSGLKPYIHIGTGNYHPLTAKVYTDLSFFTCDAALARDASYVFNFLTGYSPPENFEKLVIAPLNLRETVQKLIQDEIEHAKAGRPAQIWAKMNALIDSETIDLLYLASQAGVEIDLIVRGVCGLRPGIPGFSERIRVKSIIGRFLEHTRIFCFGAGHGLPSTQAKVFIASADWMTRNFDRRMEIMTPINNPTVHEQILGRIMSANIKDEKNSWNMQSDGKYKRVVAAEDAFSAHHFFMTNPSLSGRGKALHENDSKIKKQQRYHK